MTIDQAGIAPIDYAHAIGAYLAGHTAHDLARMMYAHMPGQPLLDVWQSMQDAIVSPPDMPPFFPGNSTLGRDSTGKGGRPDSTLSDFGPSL